MSEQTITIHRQRPTSGSKIVTPEGTKAVLDGMKPNALAAIADAEKKPDWLRIRVPNGAKYEAVMDIVRSHKLHTVCAESKCPNITECWGRGTATLMLMGSVCTRACKFCAVNTGNPHGWLDPQEPANVADAVALMGLKYVVLTSVDRDDLDDLGAGHYAACIRAIHERMPETAIEALTPDFQGRHHLVAQVLDAGLATYAQNLETVQRLTHPVRDARASYEVTLDVLKFAVVYAVPWLALRALGAPSLSLARGEFLTSLVWLIAGVLPAVSGLGPLDVAFALLFGSFAPQSAVSAALVLYRASTYFVPFAVSLPTVFIMQRTITKRLEAKGEKPKEEE